MDDQTPETPRIKGVSQGSLVLVADDDKMTHALLRAALERVGFRVEQAFDGQETIDKARQLRPDLILLDVQMPIVDGFTAVKLLRADPATHRIPIIVLTATARDPLDAARGLDLGADDYLRKPFSLEELLARVHSKVRAHQLEDRLQERTSELEALIHVGAQLNEALALDDLADRLLALMLTQIPSLCAALVLVDEKGIPTLIRLRHPDHTPNGSLFAEGTLLASVLRDGEPRLVSELPTDSVSTILGEPICMSGIAAPLIHHGEKLGAVLLGDVQAGRYTEGDLRVLRSLGEQAALAVRNAQLYAELQGYAQGLETMVETRTVALKSAQEQLMRSEKLASIGTLAAGIAHEVNNPLQPIMMCLEMTLENIDEQRPIDREMIEIAVSEVRRIERIVTGLLEFARPDRGGMSPLDLNDVIHEVLALAGKQLQYTRVNIQTDLTSISRIRGSADQLKQVVLNLVVNAMEAMPDGGLLTLQSFEGDSFVGLAVSDTGDGIDPAALPNVFDPFFTTKADGTGLGLAISYGIIEGHGGRIEVNSTPQQGTQFTIWLPKLVS